MLGTVEEAKTWWCPHALVAMPGGVVNRLGTFMRRLMTNENADQRDREHAVEVDASTRCLRTECAYWRWFDREIEEKNMGNSIAEPNAPEGDGWELVNAYTDHDQAPQYRYRSIWWRKRPNRRGYCGAAGKPSL